jgi:hypothetical protein
MLYWPGGKFFTADAAARIPALYRFLDGGRHGPQHIITDQVAVGVVDFFRQPYAGDAIVFSS